MRTICLAGTIQPPSLVQHEAPEPQPGGGELLIRVRAAGVMLTELSWYPTTHRKTGGARIGAVPTHEFSGVVAGVGADVGSLEIGREICGQRTDRKKFEMVGARGFEPPASWSRTRRSTRLSHAPNLQCSRLRLSGHNSIRSERDFAICGTCRLSTRCSNASGPPLADCRMRWSSPKCGRRSTRRGMR